LVDFSVDEFISQEESYRASGAIAERPTVSDGADAQTRVLAMFRRQAAPSV
jgi:hypothetical protein